MGDSNGPRRLAERLSALRRERGLTQEKLAERASMLDPGVTVSVDTVRVLESVRKARPLPVRPPARGKFALELIAAALGVELAELLWECFDDEELARSCFSRIVELRKKRVGSLRGVLGSESLADFITSLPGDTEDLLRLPGILQLKNEKAFAYIFALEKNLSRLEMSILAEPPVIFLDREEDHRWAVGMGLSEDDYVTFVEHVRLYREYFRNLVLTGRKRCKIVLIKRTFREFLASKSADAARAIVGNMIDTLREAPKYELVILDLPGDVDELEIISAHDEIPSSLGDTVSLLIRQTSMSARQVEYSLVPMPPTLSGLQRDISRVNQYWSLALDQYRTLTATQLRTRTNSVTVRLLQNLLERLG
ncbi:helix-turn-helix transcriptional regulator [Amycolatopsis sp. NPDC004169]|uniref:helix-turn-helix domain-containing protein n=1 Tax=Amycolatopsis sp. NPDC004169 TaxID=3154453 RepID=UPI0033AF76E3